jgi:uncharacterized membrane protein/YHS domain-containing protein
MVLGLLLCAPSKNVAGQEILNTMCPVMTDEPIDETAITVIYEGKKVLLCCKLCKRKFQDHPEQYLAALPQFASETKPPDSPQTLPDSDSMNGPEEKSLTTVIGRTHPMVVHFPIALIMLGLLLEGWSLIKRNAAYGAVVRPMIRFGALSAVVAATVGWALSLEGEPGGEALAVFERHRILGIATAVLAVMTLLFAEWGRASSRASLLCAYRVTLFACGAVLATAAHHGGLLVFGLDYFF